MKVRLAWCPLIVSVHCTLPQTSIQNPTRDPSVPFPACEGHESKLFQKARAGGTLGQLFYFCSQMVFPWPVGRAQLPINSPWPVPSFLTEDVKRGSRKHNQTITVRCREKGSGCIKKYYWAQLCDELAQSAACPHLQQMSSIHLPSVLLRKLFHWGMNWQKQHLGNVFPGRSCSVGDTERGNQL